MLSKYKIQKTGNTQIVQKTSSFILKYDYKRSQKVLKYFLTQEMSSYRDQQYNKIIFIFFYFTKYEMFSYNKALLNYCQK